MKKLLLLVCITCITTLAWSQYQKLSTNGYDLTFKKIDSVFFEEYAYNAGAQFIARAGVSKLPNSLGFITREQKAQTDPYKTILRSQQAFYRTSFYVTTDGTLQAPTSTLFFKPVSGKTVAHLGQYGSVVPHAVFKGYYYLHITNKSYLEGDKLFALCRQLFNEKQVSVIEPVFIKLLQRHNPLRPWQWNIRNTGLVWGSTPGADMGIENAWSVSTGTNTRVAVIDDGVDLTHPDLQANLVPGYDATGNNSGGAPEPDDFHGTACAGIIAAVDNTIGTIGVAHNARIIPIRMGPVDAQGFYQTNDTWQANSFNEAVNLGAAIISCSWGGGSTSTQMELAIQNAVNNGRNGLGTVVLFSAGNDNGNIRYPSTLNYVISVGASSPCDTRKREETDIDGLSCDGEFGWGSNFGPGLDVLAPGVLIPTTDNVGTDGRLSGDYMLDFNGTSAAAPNTAAVVALILSLNPALTGQQARNILENSCFKIPGGNFQPNIPGQPNGTWSNQAGYGRVDACAALRATFQPSPIQGPDQFCGNRTFMLLNVPAGATVSWMSTDPSIAQVVPPGTGPSAIIFGQGNGTATIIATVTPPVNSCFNTYNVYKTVYTTPEFNGTENISLSATNLICIGTIFNATFPSFNSAYDYVWTPSSNLQITGGNNTPNISVQATGAGPATLSVNLMTHCGNETITLPFYVGSQFDARKAPFELVSLDCITRTAVVAGQTFRGSTTYYWTVNEYMENGTFIGSTSLPPTTNNILTYPFHIKTHHGSICLMIDIGNCGISQQRCIDFTSPCPRGLRIGQTPLVGEQTPEPTNFMIYPNPVKDQLTIKLPEIPATPVTLEIISAHGQLVQSVTRSKGSQTLQLPVAQLATGQYILKIRYNKNLLTQKFIKE